MSKKIAAATRFRARISHCTFILAREVEHSLPTATMNEDYSRTSMPLMATSLQRPLFWGRTVHTWTLLQTSIQRPLSVALCSRCGGGSTVSPSPPSKDYHARNFLSQYSQNERKAAPVSLFLVKQNIALAKKFTRKCDNCRLYAPIFILLISRLTVLKQYIVLYPEKGSIAETMVRPLLNSIDFTIFFKVKLSEFTLAGPPT